MAIERILVVEDQESMRLLLCSALRLLGHPDVLTAANGVEGLKILRGRMIDLVLLDVEMPVMGGFEMLTEVRADQQLRGTPVIMVTARADVGFVKAVQPLGVLGYLVKPVTAAALRACMTRAAA